MNWEERIQIDPRVLVGKPVVKGTRLAVEFLIDLLANGWSEQQIIDNYPGITADDLHACLHYAVQILKSERVYLTPDAASEVEPPGSRISGTMVEREFTCRCATIFIRRSLAKVRGKVFTAHGPP